MRRIILILTLFISIQSFAQVPTGYQKRIVNERIQGSLMVDSAFNPPRYYDTTAANLHKRSDTCGAIFFAYGIDSLYYRACNPKRWVSVGSGSGGGSSTVSGFSVLGRKLSSSGSGVDITARNNEDVLFRNGDSLNFGKPNLITRQGNIIGDIFEKTSFADTTGMSNWGGATNIIVSNKLRIDMSTASPPPSPYGAMPRIEYDSLTSLDVLTVQAVVSLDTIHSTSYGVGISIYCQEFGYSIEGFMNGGTGSLGQISIRGGDQYLGTIYATGTDAVPGINVGDSLLYKLETFENTVTFSVRNLTDNSDWVSVSYTLVGTETKHGIGHVAITQRGGRVNLHQLKISSKQIKNPDVYLFGDSKFTKSTYQNESLVALLKNNYGQVVGNSGVGNSSSDLLLNMWEVINLVQPKKVLIAVSNDIRFSVSAATWQANLEQLYNVLTAEGTDVYFTSFYETDAPQTDMDSWLYLNYPTKYIQRAYTDLSNNPDVLLGDNIHLSAYGNRIAYDAIVLDGKLAKVGRGLFEFEAGDEDYPAVGDSIIVNTFFNGKKHNVWVDGEMKRPSTIWRPNSFRQNGDTIFIVPALATGEFVIIQSYSAFDWQTVPPEAPILLLDTDPNAAVAYSLDRINSSYSGNIIKVRRSSDNAEQDIGKIGNVLDTVSLKAFITSNSGYITTWYDQSGNGVNATQTTSANQPRIVDAGVVSRLNGKPAVDFGTESNQWWLNLPTGFLNGATTISYFQVAGVVPFGSSNAGVFAPSTTNSVGLEILQSSVSSRPSLLRINGTARNDNSGTPYFLWAANTGDQSITSVFGNPTSVSAYYNGTSVSMTNSSAMPSLNFNGVYAIGMYNSGATNMSGKVNELVIYTTDKTSNRVRILNNINRRYTTY